MEKIKLVDEAMKQGTSFNKACKLARISKKTYYKYRKPKETKETSPKSEETVSGRQPSPDVDKSKGAVPLGQKTRETVPPEVIGEEAQRLKRVKDEMAETEERLRKLGLLGPDASDHPLVKEWLGLKEKLDRTERALEAVKREMKWTTGMPIGVSPSKETGSEEKETGSKAPLPLLEEFSKGIADFESMRGKIKEFLEKLGLKVEDRWLSREEHERLVEEAKKKAVEEQLEDKRIDGVVEIMKHAVDRVVGLFQPLVQSSFEGVIKAREKSEFKGTV